jgi:hypothetical protein
MSQAQGVDSGFSWRRSRAMSDPGQARAKPDAGDKEVIMTTTTTTTTDESDDASENASTDTNANTDADANQWKDRRGYLELVGKFTPAGGQPSAWPATASPCGSTAPNSPLLLPPGPWLPGSGGLGRRPGALHPPQQPGQIGPQDGALPARTHHLRRAPRRTIEPILGTLGRSY